MSDRVLTDKITMRPYGDDGWAFSDDGCGCGAGGLAVMQTGGEPFAVEQHIAGCGDDDLPARVIVALAARVAELEAENAKLRKCVVAADAYVEAVVRIEDSPAMQGVYSIAAVHHCPYNGANWSGELANYRAARAEVDK